MTKSPRRLPSPALVVAVIALIVALGGTAYAVTELPARSVGAKQLKRGAVKNANLAKNAVTSAKVKDGSLLLDDFKPGQIPAVANQAHVGPKGDKGDRGERGEQGEPGPLLGSLPSGQTLRGSFNGGGNAGDSDQLVMASISYPIPLADNVVARVVQFNEAPPPECPGTVADPGAQPGNLCIFVSNSTSVEEPVDSYGTVDGDSDYRYGAAVSAFSTGASDVVELWGTWAVTAP